MQRYNCCMNVVKEYGIGPAGVLACGIVLAAVIGSYGFYAVKAMNNTLTVTGSATATSTADTGKLTVHVQRITGEDGISATQTRVAQDAQAVVNYFTKQGIEPESILVSPTYTDREYTREDMPFRFNIRQEISVTSRDPKRIDAISKNISSLSARGIYVTISPPQYYISNLPALRVALIGEAVKDAKARATEIAQSTGQRVGRLQSAVSGVVQVMSPNSIEVSDYGSYDTSTIEKQVMVTARATFTIR